MENLLQAAHTFGACRKVNEMEKLNRVGAGTYGVVYRARDTKNGEIVSIILLTFVISVS